MEKVAQTEVLYACWVLLLYVVMSDLYILIREAVDKINGSTFLAVGGTLSSNKYTDAK